MDQFGQNVSTLPSLTWSTNIAPTGGSATVSMSGSDATITLNRVGDYEVAVTGGGLTRNLKVKANVALTTLQLLNSSNVVQNEVDPIQTSGTSVAAKVRYLDQFGQNVTTLPSLTWSTNIAPTGGSTTVSMSGSDTTITLNRVGDYEVALTGGGLTRKLKVKANATLASLQVTPGSASVETGATQAFQAQGFDQFGILMASQPTVTWSAIGGTVSSSGVFTAGAIAGNGSVTAQAGSVSQIANISITAPLASIPTVLQILDGNNALLNEVDPVQSSGTNTAVKIRFLDQYGQVMTTIPNVSWSTNIAPTGGSATVSMSGSDATITLNRVGDYEVAVTGGGLTRKLKVKANVALTTLQLLNSSDVIQNEVNPIQTSGTSVAAKVRYLDQFGQNVSTLPSLTWSTNIAPTGGSATVSMSGSDATITLNRVGDYEVAVTGGGLTRKLKVKANVALTTLQLLNSSDVIQNEVNPIQTSETSVAAKVRYLDQFGQNVTTLPSLTWSTNIAPTGGSATVSMSGSDATITLNRVGDYEVAVTGGGLTCKLKVKANVALTTLQLLNSSNVVQNEVDPIQTSGTSVAAKVRYLDQFGQNVTTLPSLTWSTNIAPTGGSATVSMSGSDATITLNRVGDYEVAVTGGGLDCKLKVQANVALTTLQLLNSSNVVQNEVDPIQTSGTSVAAKVRYLDQFGQNVTTLPSLTWSTNIAPTGGSATVSMSGSDATITLNRVGDYEVAVTGGGLTRKLKVKANVTLTTLQVTPGTASVATGGTQAFQSQGFDQFGIVMATQPTVTWSATGGTVSSSGLFTAGTSAGVASVTAQSGGVSKSASITVTTSSPSIFQNAALAQLIQSYYVDQQLDRTEVMSVLRSVGSDSVVDSVELADLRLLVSSTEYAMPNYVRNLASDVVNSNPANLKFKGQNAGNLAAGSSSTLLNNLVDKWFLGVDVPTASATYVNSTGTLFVSAPSINDARQGNLGNCYFIASLTSIANTNPQAIRDMFLDNNDGTFTVRFFKAGVADWVTVNRMLPVNGSNNLYYAGMGLSALSSSTSLWLSLAEKAYAQWNETGNSGRNGTNTYLGLESGWMHNVNAQVLGYSSTNYSFSSSTQQTLVTALQSGLAVTAGTKSSVAAGLVSGHAYTVMSFNSSNNTFVLDNPWGFNDPSPLTWAQLQASFTIFTTTSATGTSGGFGAGFGASDFAWAVPLDSMPGSDGIAVAGASGKETHASLPLTVLQTIDSVRNSWGGAVVETNLSDSFTIPSDDLEQEASEDQASEDCLLVELALIELYLDSAVC